ncbi:cytochrome c-type biogenesis protein CcmH [Salipaludibacillus agaradhaerens]|uniref:Cytochrome c-type biogenesis protein n=1 Tax=Salipaludibacillus agaradhaerens TaxID=76935 RepID=A0A9Q4B5E1_SALAG|nr:cytochrome c-type biogenesis protein CcmH [Salipaludibacillus agaradhaerens]MCR6098450.1 cytochrome c-type biogenesis protein CcmH [Salipaludibacillus agaradhaerens]MCR6115920.1 cytochrome c-type biogenesis protein CcmH [Salipaludibacillus agaradhaerens]
MMQRRWLLVCILLFIMMPTYNHVQSQDIYTINSPEVKDIASHLAMEGHSEHDLATCTTMQRYYEEIADMLNEGYEKQDILADYEAMYGEQGFREPNKTGFSLLAWILPFIALGAGTTAFIIRVTRQVKGHKQLTEEAREGQEKGVSQDSTEDDIMKALIEEEKRHHL